MRMTQREIKLLSMGLLLLFIFTIIRNAWVSDDAYITFRAIENFRAGYGLGYNPYVRVQSFTHPLWMLLLSCGYFLQVNLLGLSLSSGLVFLTLFLSLASSALTFWVIITKIIKCDEISITLLGATVILSRAFVDYSSSGLENPLTHLLLALFIWQFFKENPNFLILASLSAMIAINRLDAELLVFPALVWLLLQDRAQFRKNLYYSLVGFSPLIAWEFFSLFYFGFLFPNTAYAKLNTGISDYLLLAQGFDYFLNSIHWDPLTLFVIFLTGVGVCLEGDRKSLILYAGIPLYLIYVLKIGGDFMSGRFLTAAFLIAAILFSRLQNISRQLSLVSLAIILLLGVTSNRSTLLDPQYPMTEANFRFVDENGIADERLVYFGSGRNQGLVINGLRDTEIGSTLAGKNWLFKKIKSVNFNGGIGKSGYQDGPNVYYADQYALVDPLMARLPVKDPVKWRIGHFKRLIPDGYEETLTEGSTLISDPDLKDYYEKLSFVISGSLWDTQRVKEIIKFNTGKYNYLILRYISHNQDKVFGYP